MGGRVGRVEGRVEEGSRGKKKPYGNCVALPACLLCHPPSHPAVPGCSRWFPAVHCVRFVPDIRTCRRALLFVLSYLE